MERRPRILVVGDAMVDRYWFGDVLRISPEAPVPVVRVEREEERAGAAANVAANARAMGAEVETVFSPSLERVVKIRVVGKNQQVVRVDFDSPQEPVSEAVFKMILPSCDLVVLSDYGKGALARAEALVWEAKREGKPVLVDPKGCDYGKYTGATVVKPNLHEMRELVGGWVDEDALIDRAQGVVRGYGLGALLLTRAEAGMTLFTEGSTWNIPSEAREVFDVSGAGDTAIAALAVGMAKGLPLDRAATLANKAAGLACARFGTAVITEAEVFS